MRGASCIRTGQAEAEKFPVNFPVTGNICGRAVRARLHPPPHSLLGGGIFPPTIYSGDIGGELLRETLHKFCIHSLID
jgi:hypothetical protein